MSDRGAESTQGGQAPVVDNLLEEPRRSVNDRLYRQEKQLERFRAEFEALRDQYRREVASIKASSAADINAIQELRRQAEQLVQLLQGGALFGRYAKDASDQRLLANHWRRVAVMVLLGTVALEVILVTRYGTLSTFQFLAPSLRPCCSLPTVL